MHRCIPSSQEGILIKEEIRLFIKGSLSKAVCLCAAESLCLQQPEDSLFQDLSPVQGTQRLFHPSIEELYIKRMRRRIN